VTLNDFHLEINQNQPEKIMPTKKNICLMLDGSFHGKTMLVDPALETLRLVDYHPRPVPEAADEVVDEIMVADDMEAVTETYRREIVVLPDGRSVDSVFSSSRSRPSLEDLLDAALRACGVLG
jgi:hypothetical protein